MITIIRGDNKVLYLWQKSCQNEEEDDERGNHACAHTSRVEEKLTPLCTRENS